MANVHGHLSVCGCLKRYSRNITAPYFFMTVSLFGLTMVMLGLSMMDKNTHDTFIESQQRHVAARLSPSNVKTKAIHTRLYVYSVHVESDHEANKRFSSKITALGWIYTPLLNRACKCCLLFNDNRILSTSSETVIPGFTYRDTPLSVVMHVCHVQTNLKGIKGVAIDLKDTNCPTNSLYYLKPIVSTQVNGTIGQCAKLIYGNIDGRRLIEWFEFQRLVGVSRIVAYEYNITSQFAMEVLEYYERDGLLSLVRGFDFPEKDSAPRRVGEKTMQAFYDERVVLMDCMMRLKHFRYVAVMDVDEFMIPIGSQLQSSWWNFLEDRFKAPIGIITFPQVYHLDLGTFNSSRLLLEQSTSGTAPVFDKTKNIFMPERVHFKSISVHNLHTLSGYQRLYIDKEKAITHHYRACRSEWNMPTRSVPLTKRSNLPEICSETGIVCSDFCQRPYPITQNYASAIEKRVHWVKQEVLTRMYIKSLCSDGLKNSIYNPFQFIYKFIACRT